MTGSDLYSELGLSKGASKDDIKRAYRALAKELHPDRNPDDARAEERFKRVAYAHDVLTDDKKRSLYDEFGEVGLKEGFDAERARGFGGAGPGAGGFSGFEDILRGVGRANTRRGGFGSSVEDLFGGGGIEDLFSGMGRQARPAKGADHQSEIRISFEEAIQGVEKELSVRDGADTRTLRVRIPAGVRDGGKVRLRGQGGRSGVGAAGDLVLTVHVDEHAFYRRDGDDLHLDLPVTLSEAWKGASLSVPTPSGNVSLRVPARVQSGAKLRLRGKGVAGRKGNAGDLFVHIQIRLPDGADEERVAEALEALEGEYDPGLRAHLR